MEINLNVDFDENTVHMLIENHVSVTVYRDEDGAFSYNGLSKVTDSYLKERLKSLARVAFSLEEN